MSPLHTAVIGSILAGFLAIATGEVLAQADASLRAPGDATRRLEARGGGPGAVPGPAPLAPGDIINSVAGVPGGAPLGITIVDDSVTETVLVNDLFSGLAQGYGLDLVAGASLANPVGGGGNLCTGVAFISDGSQRIFWIDGSANLLYETDLAGVVLDIHTVVPPNPGAILADMAYASVSDTLWIDDIANDLYFEVNLDGTTTGSSFPNPDDLGTGAMGNGISHVGSGGLFDIPTGFDDPVDPRVSRVRRVDPVGTVLDTIEDLDVSTGDDFINGVVWHASGSTGVEVNYLVGNATNTIFEIEMTLAGSACGYAQISDITCSQVGADVSLSWVNNGTYDSIELFRDGVSIALLAGTAAAATDLAPPPGAHSYTVESTLAGETCGGGGCDVVVLTPTQRLVDYPGSAPFGATINETENLVVVGDLDDGVAYTFDRDLSPVGTIPSPAGLNTITGIAWHAADNSYYFIDADLGLLIHTDATGGFLDSFPIASPGGGLLGGMTIGCGGDTLIVNDIAADEYYEFILDGTPTGFSFHNPDDVPAGTGAFGNGIAVAAAGDGYDLPVGTLADGLVDRIARVGCDGVDSGETVDVGPGSFFADEFINGVVNTATAPAGAPLGSYRYVVGNASGQIFADLVPGGPAAGETFRRGDANGDGVFDISDAVYSLAALFVLGSPAPSCADAADSNDDGVFDISDAVYSLAALFVPGSAPPPEPGPVSCGLDPTDDGMSCDLDPACP